MGRYRIAVAIFVAVVLVRLPFATTHLWAWDSVLYARALEQGFHVDADLGGARPHPPGYIWYVAAAAGARAFLGDSNAALVLVSILASAAGTALLYLIARRYVRPAIALLVALAYAASPVVWTYSEVAYPYTVLGLTSTALGGLLLARRWPLLASLAFGVLSGARQDLLILLAPLWLWSVRPLGVRGMFAAAGIVATGALTWLIPSAISSDGPGAYAAALLQQAERVTGTYSAPVHGLPALIVNAGFTLEAVAWGMGLLAVPLAASLIVALRARARGDGPPPGQLAVALALWSTPALAFYTLVHIGEWGYVLSILPPLLIAAGVVLERAVPPRPSPRWAVGAAAAVLVPALVFLLGDGAYAVVAGDAEFSAAALARHDARMAADIAYLRSQLPPASTVILAREDHLLVRYYLPEYRSWYWDPAPFTRSGRRHRAMRPMTVVVLTPGLQPLLQGDVRRVEIAPRIELAYLTLDQGNTLELLGERYVVRETPVR